MHGKKREEYKAKTRDPKTAAILAKKAEQWYILMKELHNRREKQRSNESGSENECDSETTLKLLGKALEVNPDPSNLWNHRREVILREIRPDDDKNDNQNDKASNILHRERVLTQKALERNPKAYGAWFHRKWILQTLRPASEVLQQELALTKRFLSVDERNFHCWNYRRFVVACVSGSWDGEWTVALSSQTAATTTLMGTQAVVNRAYHTENDDEGEGFGSVSVVMIPIESMVSEFEFTTEKIKQNFSNFSAFHYRSQLLDCLCHNGDGNGESPTPEEGLCCLVERILEDEFQLVEDAVCTEPDDQTCWWYHAILLDKLLLAVSEDGDHKNGRTIADSWKSTLLPRLEEQADLFREILEDSPGSKWVILGLVRVLNILSSNDGDPDGDNGDEQEQLLRRLMEIDPYRSKRYEELRTKKE